MHPYLKNICLQTFKREAKVDEAFLNRMPLQHQSASSPIAGTRRTIQITMRWLLLNNRWGIFATVLNSVLLLHSYLPSLSFLVHLPTVFYTQERPNVIAVAMAMEQG